MNALTAVKQAVQKRRMIREAKRYVTGGVLKNWTRRGEVQLGFLQQLGCVPDSVVLEVGCGCLSAGKPLMEFLEPGHYVGIEPNRWLLDAICQEKQIAELLRLKKPKFLYNESFDASEANLLFDYVFAHSILSHAAHWQLEQFLANVRKVVKPTATVLASIRMSDRKGNPKTEDSNHESWQYPGVSYFTFETVTRRAAENGFEARWAKSYREEYTTHFPAECHDWLVLSPR